MAESGPRTIYIVAGEEAGGGWLAEKPRRYESLKLYPESAVMADRRGCLWSGLAVCLTDAVFAVVHVFPQGNDTERQELTAVYQVSGVIIFYGHVGRWGGIHTRDNKEEAILSLGQVVPGTAGR